MKLDFSGRILRLGGFNEGVEVQRVADRGDSPENEKLKRMYADQALEIAAIKEVLTRKR